MLKLVAGEIQFCDLIGDLVVFLDLCYIVELVIESERQLERERE